MNEVTITLVRDEESSHMNIAKANDGHIDKIIEGFFALTNSNPIMLTAESIDSGTILQPAKEFTPKKFYPEPIKASAVSTPKAVEASLTPEPAPKHVHNDTQVEGNPTKMSEVYNLSIPDNAPEHVRTGIKKGNDGKTNRYKCRYTCTKCKKQANHYIPEGVETVDCYDCQTTLNVRKATPGTQGIQPDKFMNWFVAGDQRPVQKFVYTPTFNVKK